MYRAPRVEAGERLAAGIADRIASWWFPTIILVGVVSWVAFNALARPFEPFPVIFLAWISATLATVAACQGPLILLSQRRSAMHDRERDDETLRVATNTESDLHRLTTAVTDIDSKLDRLLIE